MVLENMTPDGCIQKYKSSRNQKSWKRIGTQIIKIQKKIQELLVGHDYRSYSEEIKKNLKKD